jgi:two-component system chemotaxis response regulator CheB
MNRSGPIKVLIVDDSALVRSILMRVLAGESDIRVIGGAKDPYEARELIIQHKPDVIILDIEMPRMDGLTFLRKLRAHYPVPVIMCSSIAPANSRIALEAIAAGAVDIAAKPTSGGREGLQRLGEDLADKIRAAVVAKSPAVAATAPAARAVSSFREAGLDPSRYIVAIGASTGGTEAIRQVLMHVPPDFPPVVMVQHMPAGFTQSFAGRLDSFSPLKVTEAAGGETLEPGKAFLARGDVQMHIRHAAGRWKVEYGGDEPVNRHCPSVDYLFDSVVPAGPQAIGVLLTGMGADGARGLLRMRQAGAITLAQSAESCVVYGMPKVAVELGAAQLQCPPGQVAPTIINALRKRDRRRATADIA